MNERGYMVVFMGREDRQRAIGKEKRRAAFTKHGAALHSINICINML